MPIRFTAEKGWYIDKPTPAELKSIAEVGKMMIVQGLAGSYTNERYKAFLVQTDVDHMFNA